VPQVPLCMGCLMIASKGSHLFWHTLKLVYLPINAICAGCGKPFLSESAVEAAENLVKVLKRTPILGSQQGE
jgi:hypothetical protein